MKQFFKKEGFYLFWFSLKQILGANGIRLSRQQLLDVCFNQHYS